jgi:hypothetical protein
MSEWEKRKKDKGSNRADNLDPTKPKVKEMGEGEAQQSTHHWLNWA